MTTVQNNPRILAANALLNKTLKNSEGEEVGEIKDVAFDVESNHVSYVVVEFGGFMGMGKKWFAIPPRAVVPSNTEADVLCLNVDKKVLKEATGFDKDEWPDTADYQWLSEVYKHYGYDPYWS
tara:strand:+ start:773 stop:1141 length:369 start_codon:yes stop_codon:yes gene_type:complete